MTSARTINYSPKTLPRGFTLLELIIVIIILGILAVTVTPKFFSSNGFSEYAYRADAIAKLRLIQTKAMQQAVKRVSNCHRVLVTSKRLGAPDDCDDSPSFTSDWQETATGLVVDIDDTVTFSSNIPGNNFTFDSLGRPDSCGPCDITIIGEQEIKLRIESEGYIHAL